MLLPIVVLSLAFSASAWPYCEIRGSSQCEDPSGSIQGSYCMIDPSKKPPYNCHGAAPNVTACGKYGEDASVPAAIAAAHKTITVCEASGKGSATSCSDTCNNAFVDYITYGDSNICFEITSGMESTFYPETRSEINDASDTSGCSRTGGGCVDGRLCGAHGKCIHPAKPPASSSYCLCDPGWDGLYCGTSYSCPDTCSSHGVCFPSNVDEKTGKCHCNAGWKGDDCKTPDGKPPTPPSHVCDPNTTGGCNVCGTCCKSYLKDQGDCNACVQTECPAVCDPTIGCSVCEACCKSYLKNQDDCTACAQAECKHLLFGNI